MALSTTNPLISQGTLNRLIGSVQISGFPQLNVTASFLGKEGIGMRRETAGGEAIDTMTGFVTSPAPYMRVGLTIHMLRTQGLASLWEQQLQVNVLLGNIVVRIDSSIHPPYPLSNSMLMTVEPYRVDGSDPSYVAEVLGIYYINAALWT